MPTKKPQAPYIPTGGYVDNVPAKFRPVGVKNIGDVLRRLAHFLDEGDAPERAYFVGPVEDMLEEARMNDVFGTEGQIDPRGDYRERR